MKRYSAVVFDLFGTLIDLPNYAGNRDEMADVLGADRDKFAAEWAGAMNELMTGGFPSIEAALVHICKRLGEHPGIERIRVSAKLRFEFTRGAMIPRPGVVDAYTELSDRGYKVGLISNCMEEVSVMWDSTPFAPMFDVAVLSSDVGMAKPDPRIYALSAVRLGVDARDCLYVGDGSDGELSGAEQAGMTAVLIRAPYDQADGDRQGWDGRRISRLAEVLGLA